MISEQRREAVIAALCAGTLPREHPLASVTFDDQCYVVWNEERERSDGVD